MTYIPRPLSTDDMDIMLTEAQKMMVEHIAIHLHDMWALKRMAEGWKYGPERNDTKKTHPCLVPYGDLPKSEREYDLMAARETFKAYRILSIQFGKCL